MVRVFDLECNLPSEGRESLVSRHNGGLGPVTPNRTVPLPGYGLARNRGKRDWARRGPG